MPRCSVLGRLARLLLCNHTVLPFQGLQPSTGCTNNNTNNTNHTLQLSLAGFSHSRSAATCRRDEDDAGAGVASRLYGVAGPNSEGLFEASLYRLKKSRERRQLGLFRTSAEAALARDVGFVWAQEKEGGEQQILALFRSVYRLDDTTPGSCSLRALF
jgi:hypothetical protein